MSRLTTQIGLLRYAGPGGRTALACYVVCLLIAAATPPSVAVLVGKIVGVVVALSRSSTEDGRYPFWQLSFIGAVLLLGQVATAINAPLAIVVERRIDGASRQEIMRRVGSVATMDRVESEAMRNDISTYTTGGIAWMQSGLGAGVLAQIRQVTSYLTVVQGAVLLGYLTWWWGLTAFLVCIALREIDARGFLGFECVVKENATDMRRTRHWRELLDSRPFAREVRLFGLAHWLLKRHDESLLGYSASLDYARRRLRARQLLLLLLVVSMCTSIYFVIAAAGSAQLITVSDLAIALGLTGAMVTSGDVQAAMQIESAVPIASALERLRSSTPVTEPLLEPVDESHPASETHDESRQAAPPEIALREVEFAYSGAGEPVLRGLTLHLRPGEVLAVVGTNGAGKSTIASLVAGLRTPACGEITADGVPLSTIPRETWAHTIHCVYQDAARFELSAIDNIRLAAPAADTRDIAKAARRTGLDQHISRLPRQWGSPLGAGHPGGVEPSGGQWQSFALTRALLALSQGSKIVVLDEPTASLDIEAEMYMFESIVAFRGGASLLLITHRLATARHADRIAVIDAGRVSECGSHTELMALKGQYAEMFRLQADAQLTLRQH